MARMLEFKEKVLSAASTLNTASTPIDVPFSGNFKAYINWSAGVTAGKVAIYEAHDKGYTGTWFKIAEIDFVTDSQSADSTVPITQGTYPYGALKAVVTTAISGGTVDVWLLGT